ncbi:MAG: AAA family ATPase [Nitrososphaeria archaeon]|jgi:replication factor C large subunit
MLSEKYRPKSIFYMIGNEEGRKRIILWLKNWKKGSKPLLIVGPPGTGKTTSIKALGNDFNLFVLELNASDIRTKEKLEATLKNVEPVNLFGQRVIVFLDEIDGMYSKGDAGGINFLQEWIPNANVPVIMAANEMKDFMKDLAKMSEIIEWKKVPSREVFLWLKNIAEKENLKVNDEQIKNIIYESSGDIRYAVNQLQVAQESIVFKDVKYSAEDAIKNAMYAKNFLDAYHYISNWQDDPDTKLTAVAATIFYNQPLDLDVRARWISEADLLLGRIKKFQEWRLLRYFNVFLTIAVYNARGNYNQYLIPFPVIQENYKRPIYNGLLEALKKDLHFNIGFIASDIVPLYEFLVKMKKIKDENIEKVLAGKGS